MRTLSTSYVHCQNAAPHPQAVGLEYVRHRTTRICVHQFCSWACSNEAIPMGKRMKVSHFETLRNSDAKCWAKNAKIRFVVFDLSSSVESCCSYLHVQVFGICRPCCILPQEPKLWQGAKGALLWRSPLQRKHFSLRGKLRSPHLRKVGTNLWKQSETTRAKGCTHWQTAFKGQAARKDT